MRHVTSADFASVIASESPVLVDFWAEWCGPCLRIAPLLEEIAQEQAGKLEIVKLNVDEQEAVSRQYRVLSIPTLILFRQGQEVARFVGLPRGGKDALLEAIQPHLVGA